MAPLDGSVFNRGRAAPGGHYWRELRDMSRTVGFLGDQVVRLTRELRDALKQRDEVKKELQDVKKQLEELRKEK